MGELWYVHNGILLSDKNEILASTRNILAARVEGEKPDTEEHLAGDST